MMSDSGDSEAARRAASLYARAVVILQESLRHRHDRDLWSWLWIQARRTVQEILDLCRSDPESFLWLVHEKNREEYLPTHGTNVAILAILTGQRAGLPRRSLRDLGAAGLFHDIGKIGVPAHVRMKGGGFGEDEIQEMRRHPVHGMNMLLGLGSSSASVLRLMIVLFEHNIDSNGYPRPVWPSGLHLFSRIVAIADAYDAMTTPRSFRPGQRPDEAMREIGRGAGTRYDRDLVEVFRSLMGVYPRGTLVRLDTAELGLVTDAPIEDPLRPRVLLVADAAGHRLESGPIVDLSERDATGRFARSIARSEDPGVHGINVPGFAGAVRAARCSAAPMRMSIDGLVGQCPDETVP